VIAAYQNAIKSSLKLFDAFMQFRNAPRHALRVCY
jgi:hypothetical protein